MERSTCPHLRFWSEEVRVSGLDGLGFRVRGFGFGLEAGLKDA